ncbi:hypothetical protein JW898_02425 [Candidatus Woesearchaeota archaeon]|nr:hypothetical protein [Candidatus Woesearchaeota archaeon]
MVMSEITRPGKVDRSWIHYDSDLLRAVKHFEGVLRRCHSMRGGSPDQVIQLVEEPSELGDEQCIHIFVEPLGVELTYIRELSESRVDPLRKETITRVDEVVLIGGQSAPLFNPLKNSYLVHEDGGFIATSEDPLLDEAVRTPRESFISVMMQQYLDASLAQTRAQLVKKGIVSLPVENFSGVPGVRRRVNLRGIDKRYDAEGRHYRSDDLKNLILRTMKDLYSSVSHIWYDKLYILERFLLVDCGDHSVLEGIAGDVAESNGGRFARCDEFYRDYAGRMSVYEHDDAVIRLVERIFPESGSVYLYVHEQGFIQRIFNCYVVQAKGMVPASVNPDHLRIGRRNSNTQLNLHFIGEVAEAEYSLLKKGYDPSKREVVRQESQIDRFLDDM